MVSIFFSPAYRNRGLVGIAVAAAAVGLGLSACAGAARPSPTVEPGPLFSREVAVGLASTQQVDNALASSMRTLRTPFRESRVEAFALLAGIFALAADPGAAPPDTASCVPALDDGADGDGDGYPDMETTLPIACDLYGFSFEGELTLMDEDDTNVDSGFSSELTYGIDFTVDGETAMSFSGGHALAVSAQEDGAGFKVTYRGTDRQGGALMISSALSYEGILTGSTERGTMEQVRGTITAAYAADCSMLTGAEASVCREQAPDDPFSFEVELALDSPSLGFDTEECTSALTGGHFNVRDGEDVLTITYAGCGERSATYNDQPVVLPPTDE